MSSETGSLRRWGRRMALAATIAVAAAIALVLALHTPFARRYVLDYALATVREQYGLDLEAERLDYNLAARRAALAGVRISAPGSPDEPFFEADLVSVTVPRAILFGEVSFDEVLVANGLVRVVRHADGTTNLPEPGEPSGEEPPPLRIDRLSIQDLALDIRDEQGDLSLTVPALSILLTPEDGELALRQPADVRVADRTTRLGELQGAASFDGRALRLSNVRLSSDEAAVIVNGALDVIAADPTVNVQLEGTADVERAARWGIAEGDLPQGTVVFTARVTGPMTEPSVSLDATSDRLSYQSLTVTDVSTRLGLTPGGVDLESLALGFEGGRVNASGAIPFGETAPGRIDASWTGIDTASAILAAAPGTTLVPAGTISGEVQAQGTGTDVARWSGDARIDLVAGRNARGRLAAAGSSRLRLADGRWQLDGRHDVGGVAPVTLALRGRLPAGGPDGPPLGDTTVEGTVGVAETDVPALLDVLRLVGVADVAPEAVTAGTLEADARMSGTLVNPSIEAQARARGVSGQQVDVGTLDATVSGRPAQPQLAFTIVAPAAVLAGQPLNELDVAGQLADGTIVLDRLAARQPAGPGSIAGKGTYNPDTGRYTANLDAAGWQITPTDDLPLSGLVAARITGEGTVEAPRGMGDITLEGGTWQETALGPLDASFVLDGRTAAIQANAPDFNAEASASIVLDAPYDATVDLTARGLDLARVLRDLETAVPLEGTTTVVVHAEGPLDAWRSGSGTIEAASFDARTGELPIRLSQPALVRYEGERVFVDRLEADAGETHLSASGELAAFEPDAAAGMLVTITGDVGAVAQAASAAGVTNIPITGGTGPVALLARVTGSMLEPVVAADLEVGPGTVALQDLAPIADLRVRAHAEEGWVEVREASASYEGASIAATGRAPLAIFSGDPGNAAGDAELSVRATNLTPSVLQAVVDPGTLEQIGGSVDATLELTTPALDLADVTGELRFSRLEVRVADLPVTQRVPTRLVLRDGFARIESWDWMGQGATLDVRGQVRLSDLESGILANGSVDLRMLTPFVRDAGMTTAGRLVPRLSITGPIDNPRIDGDLTITNGEVRLAEPRMLVSNLGVRTVLTRTSANITSMTGTVNGGPLTGSGFIAYRPDGRIDAQLTTDIRGMAMEFPDGLRSEVNAALQLALAVPPQAPPSGRLAGTITVVRGAYREPLAVVTGLLTTLRTNRLAAAGGGAEVSPLMSGLALDVRLLTDEDLIVDNNYGRLQLGADLRIIGTAAAPSLSGRAELREGGQLFVGRNDYTVTAGTVDFSNPVTIEPDLNVMLSTRAGGEDIEVTISGTPEAPAVDLASSTAPELGQAEIASLLLTGRRLENLAPGDAAFLGTQVLGNFSAEVLGFAGRAVGLDSIRLGGVDAETVRRDPTAVATELDPTSRLTFGKSLGTNVDVTFSQSLRDSAAQTWIVEYYPARVLELRLVSDDEDLRSYGFRHELTFGTGVPRTGRPATVSRRLQAADVARVTLGGDLVFPEARVRDVLRLEPGDRFDFVEWQTDRDRLEAFYRQQGYLAVRTDASREDTDAGVVLAYEVTPGPETRIALSGMDLNGALRGQLETAWAESVFDDFLTDEAETIVRSALADDRYFQPVVQARLEDEGSVRTLAIDVERGERSTETIVRVEGAGQELTAEIDEWLADAGLVERAALDPSSVEDGVRGYLRASGYLRAQVTAGTPAFDGGTAVVPLRVESGPVFQIVSLAFTGAERLDVATLRSAAGLAEGMPYDPASQDDARLALIGLYRREGFASPAIVPVPRVSETSPAVDLVFEIEEGPRQIVRDVTVAGNRAIDPDVIQRTLDLPAGAPLRSADLLQARTRLFDTGLFRRVDVAAEDAEPSADAAISPMDVRVTVEEWPALRLRYGFQVAEERPEANPEGRELTPGLSSDLVRRTLFGRAITVGSVFELQRRERTVRGFANTGSFFGLPIQSSFVVDRSRETLEAVTLVTDRTGVTLEQRARVLGNLTLSYAYRFERNRTFDTDPPPGQPAFDITVHIGRWTGSAAWDTRDDPADTTRGLLASTSFEFAPESAGSDIRFVRQLAQVYYFRPVGRVVLASAGRLGTVTPLGGQEVLRLFRFFAGGSRTVRGVSEDGLGDRDFFGDPVGGRSMLVLNEELRMPIYGWVRGVAFLDAGNVFPRFDRVRLGDLVGSAGLGLRLETPFALLRVDYGRVLWPTEQQQSGRWTFGIGHAF